ncbi:uncharacterized protein LOC135384619, partial [Ornithodoros turicata]|uniref:uncharacterized protein LOC135384619 n=1 Tax=Ornithodoros turicata TaxID=34597 RepID=UPI003138B32A
MFVSQTSTSTQTDKMAKALQERSCQTDPWEPPAKTDPTIRPEHMTTPSLPADIIEPEDEDSSDSYSPSQEESSSDEDEACHPCTPYQERKFVVFESCLLELFRTCPQCFARCTNNITTQGTMISVKSQCTHGHVQTWDSQPMVNGRPAGNLLLSGAMFFSGVSAAPTLRMLRHISIQTFSLTTYYKYQSSFLVPAVEKVWLEEQKQLIDQLRGQAIDVSGDGRCDSPGFSAKYMTYNVHVDQINKIIHSAQIQLAENERVMASVQMEKEGLIRSIQFLKEQGITLNSITTDRHPAIRKHMETHEPGTKHYFDIWHISKGLKKKLSTISKSVTCRGLDPWIQGISNHLYWCARAGGGDAQLTVDMWLSVQNHIINVHDGHKGSYPRCLHDPIPDGVWLDPDSVAYRKFKEVTGNKRILKDVAQMSPSHQTYALESFHSLLIRFAPKSVAFSPEGMLCRTRLAILHYNENAERCQAETLAGSQRWK